MASAKAAEAARAATAEDLPFYTDGRGARRCSRIIQTLDPPGVGARDLRECLLLQLREAGLEQSVPYRLVRDCFDELINHRWSEISKRFGISAARRADGRRRDREARPEAGPQSTARRRQLHHPRSRSSTRSTARYHVFLNDANLPRLKLSRAYQEIARDKKKFDGENKEFISNKLNSANWMIQAIEQRRQTMLKVMNFIVDRQREFFEKGVQYLKPLTLREVAEVINMHESTVSRVTNEKFVQTPRGVLPLKFFFSSGLSTTAGEDVSARGIKAQIEKLVAGRGSEAPAHRSGDRQHPEGERRPDRAPHRRQVPRPARRPLRPDAQARMTPRRRGIRPHAAIDVSVLVPAKDEAENLPLFMEQAAAAFADSTVQYEVVVIDDGSLRRHAGACSSRCRRSTRSCAWRGTGGSAASRTRSAPATSPRAAACSSSIPPTSSTSRKTFRGSSRPFWPASPTWSPASSRASTRRRSCRASTMG